MTATFMRRVDRPLWAASGAIVLLLVARDWATRVLGSVRGWLERNARTVAAVIVVLLAASLLRNGIAGLTG